MTYCVCPNSKYLIAQLFLSHIFISTKSSFPQVGIQQSIKCWPLDIFPVLFCVNRSLFLCVNFSQLFPIHQLNDRAWPRIFYSQRQNTISRPQFLQVALRGANAPQIRNYGLETKLCGGSERCHKTVQVRIVSIYRCHVHTCLSLQLIIVFVNAVANSAAPSPLPQRTASDFLQ